MVTAMDYKLYPLSYFLQHANPEAKIEIIGEELITVIFCISNGQVYLNSDYFDRNKTDSILRGNKSVVDIKLYDNDLFLNVSWFDDFFPERIRELHDIIDIVNQENENG